MPPSTASLLRVLVLTIVASLPAPAADETALAAVTPAPDTAPLALRIGVSDIYCKKTACACIADIAARSYDGTLAALEKDHKIHLEMTYLPEVRDLENEFKAGKFDGVICKPWNVLRSVAAGADPKRVADITDPQGRPVLTGVFLVPVKSPLRTLADVAGKRLAFGKDDAFEKYHAPLRMLAEAKVTPATAVYFSSCQENLDSLMSGTTDAIVVSDYALTASCAVDFAKPEDFRTIATTAEMPLTSVIVDMKKVSPADAARFQRALFALAGAKTPPDLLGKGFVKPMSWKPVPVPAAMVPKPAKKAGEDAGEDKP